MKPAQPAATGRTPYAERPEVLAKWCSCHYTHNQHEGRFPQAHNRYWTDPNCKLHGDHAKEATF